MNKLFRTALVLAFFACASSLLIVTASAQSVYGSIFGTVSDKSGAVVPNATITVTDEAKGTVVTVQSNGAGDYSVPHLIPDVYDLKVVAKGFSPFETKGISVQADTAPRIDPTLNVGSDTGTTVEVNADAQPELKTDKADVSTVFDQQQVSSLPVGDQNFTNLQLLVPGAQLLGWSHAADENPQGSQQIQVDGQAFGGTAFELDGTDNQDPILGIIVINPAMDAVTETKITTQNYDAELGKAVSAVVTAQTRSGTNKFHGSAYDFRTGNANLARNPFSQYSDAYAKANGLQPSIPPGLKNRFGGSIGGPVIRDKGFFFFNWESQRQKVGTTATGTVPTTLLVNSCLGTATGPSGIAGCDFSEYDAIYRATKHLSAGIPMLTNNTGNPAYDAAFAADVIPTALVSPQAQALLAYFKNFAPNQGTANLSAIENNYSAGGTGLFNSNSWTTREDYTLNDKMHAFARFSRFWDTLSGKVLFGAAGGPGFGLGGYGGNSNGANDSLASGMDIAISPKLLTDFRLGYYRYNVIDTKYDQGVEFANTIGIPGINTGSNFTSGAPGWVINNPGGGNANIGAGLNINRCNCPLTEREDQFQIVNNWTVVKGNHTLKVGADLRYGRNLRVPSDTDRAGQLNFQSGETSAAGTNGLSWASFALGDVNSFGRYVSTSTNAKEFQKRTFFYGQDTWRVTKNLTLNLGLRWELYFPEAVNGKGNGSLMNLADGYMHVAGVGQVPTDMGWSIQKKKAFDPRIGVTYQLDEKTVLRAGYGRSFDTGVFGSIFGHVVTQNLPVLANQSLNAPNTTGSAFTMAQGPPAFVFPTVPSNGLLPAQGNLVSPKARPNPLHFPTIDAWNLSVQRALTPTLSVTAAYIGNKGTHTLGDTDQNNTDPNESALFLPGQFSTTGQTLHWDPNGLDGVLPAGYSGGVKNSRFLKRYYGGTLAACRDSAYVTPTSEPNVLPGMCGWTNNISYYGDDQNTEFDALQVTVSKSFTQGLSLNANYQWANAWGDQNGYWTWDHHVTHLRDSNVRAQQLVSYGSYDLPFGRGKQLAPNANHATDLIIGGFQLAYVLNWSGGLPYSVNMGGGFGTNQDCNNNTGGSAAPCRPNASGRMKRSLTSAKVSGGTVSRDFWTPQPQLFSFPGLDVIGNAGANTYHGPSYFNTDLAITKGFTIRESIVAKFRMDAFNGFNHISPGGPDGNIFGTGHISGAAPGPPNVGRQLEFSARIQF
jgi:outer membrane receptor protein involved in Fe transport